MKSHRSALVVAVLLVASSVDANSSRFTPVSFISRKSGGEAKERANLPITDGVVVPNQKNAYKYTDVVDQASNTVVSTRAGSTASAQDEDIFKVKLSYFADIIWSVMISVFLVLWIKSRNALAETPPSFPYFDESVLEKGFCNKMPSPPHNTQRMCGIVDLILVTVTGIRAKMKDTVSPLFLFAAGYTLFHGAIHFVYSLGIEGFGYGPMDTVSLVFLGLVLVIGPMGLYLTITVAPSIENKDIALPIAGIFWAVLTLIYGIVLKEKQYALTYINVVIFLGIYLPRAFLIGYKDPADVEARKELVGIADGRFWPYVIFSTLAIGIMCAEPLACAEWFGNIGGHVWFDVALFGFLYSQA